MPRHWSLSYRCKFSTNFYKDVKVSDDLKCLGFYTTMFLFPNIWLFISLLQIHIRCVKFVDSYLAKECTKIKEAESKYINCYGNYTTKYSKYLALIQKEIIRCLNKNKLILKLINLSPAIFTTAPQLFNLPVDYTEYTYASCTASDITQKNLLILVHCQSNLLL